MQKWSQNMTLHIFITHLEHQMASLNPFHNHTMPLEASYLALMAATSQVHHNSIVSWRNYRLFPRLDEPGFNLACSLDQIYISPPKTSLSVAGQTHLECPNTPAVKHFSSVAYVLQVLADDPVGVDMLRKMNIVGVGGAALPQSVGDMLVSKRVNLVSHFGSAECGLLLSSHRHYKSDKARQYLRVTPKS